LPDGAERTNLYVIAVCDRHIFGDGLGNLHSGKRIAISRTFDGDALAAQPDIYETSQEGEKIAMNMPHEMHETPPANGENESERHGKIGWAVLWLLGVPLPVLLVLYLLTGGGCNGG
jgi:hypothetical protein